MREPSLQEMEGLAGLLTDSTARATGGPVVKVEAQPNWPETTFSVVLTERTPTGDELWHYELGPDGRPCQEPVQVAEVVARL